MTRCSGKKSTSIIEELVRKGTSLIPGIAGTETRPPTLMKILSASRTSSLTITVRGDSKRACPWMTVQFSSPRSHFSTPLFDRPLTSSFRAFTRFISTRTSPLTTKPYSAPRRARWAAYALATSVLVGMHPVFTQVPPNLWRSMMATAIPSAENRAAKDGPAWPVPIMIASKCRDTRHPPLTNIADYDTVNNRHAASAMMQRLPGAAVDDDQVLVVYWGNSLPDCSATMYAAYQSGQFSSRCPVRFSCCPWAASARRNALARSVAEE